MRVTLCCHVADGMKWQIDCEEEEDFSRERHEQNHADAQNDKVNPKEFHRYAHHHGRSGHADEKRVYPYLFFTHD